MSDMHADRKAVLYRFLYTLVIFIAFEVVRLLAQLGTLVQYGILLATRKHSEPLRTFCNTMSRYAYLCLRYMTLNSNARPFPFSPLPKDAEAPESDITYGK
ncbi:hypothetical protein GGQ74_001082 [Desulfobaculum xiamenense]|uniref:Glucose-1-phosphate thymidylyltransferase n=1 Tax=Desulfobaculum xiamenense TaxID=995050 RepID=A0A846QLW0_9BACT|nr:DUF4389 domain-containing protein [Desulfobaculum xiamenense]NJB67442.1 hypothetical protein [Desulfobaculum xiamenense]